MSLRTYMTSAVVLHRINLGEHDRILTLYTLEHGKLSAIAKGARKPMSKLAGATELFTHSRMQLAMGRTLEVVTQTETVASFQRIRGDLGRIAYASVIAEMIDRFIEERDPHPEVFSLLVDSLWALERLGPPALITQVFALHLLSALGYRPHIEGCVLCGASGSNAPAAFSPALGGGLCRAHRRQASDAIPVHSETLSLVTALYKVLPTESGVLKTLAQHVTPSINREIEQLLRVHIQYRLERTLRSLDFVQAIQSMESSGYQASAHPEDTAVT